MEIDPGCGTEWALRSWSNTRIQQISDGIEEARMLGINHLEARSRPSTPTARSASRPISPLMSWR